MLQPSTRAYLAALLRLSRAQMTTISAVTHLAASLAAPSFAPLRFLHAWLFILLTQFTTHFLGEVYDYPSDAINHHATRFTGGSKVLVTGLITVRHALILALCTAIMALVTIWSLPASRSLALLIFVLATQYSAPPFLLNHRALGELDATLITSFLVPLFSFSIQTPLTVSQVLSHPLLLYLIIPPLFTKFSLFLVLNMADRRPDWAASKITVPVLLGDRLTARAHTLLLFSSYFSAILISLFCFSRSSPHAIVLLFLLPSIPVGRSISRRLHTLPYQLDSILPRAMLHSTLLVWGVLLYTVLTRLPIHGLVNVPNAFVAYFAYLTFSPIIRSHLQQRAHKHTYDPESGRRCACHPEAVSPIMPTTPTFDEAGRPLAADVVVVGAGVAGLTAAATLDRLGISVCILEKRAEDYVDSGADLALWPGAITILKNLGVPAHFFEAQCFRLDEVHMCNMDFGDGGVEVLKTIDMKNVTEHTGEPFVLVARTKLMAELRKLVVGKVVVQFECKVAEIDQSENEATVWYSDAQGERRCVVSRVVVGADGARSPTRQHVHPELRDHVQYCGEVCYRGVLDITEDDRTQEIRRLLPDAPDKHCMRINYGAGLRSSFGYMSSSGDSVYWWVKVLNATPPADTRKLEHCTWPEPLKTLHDMTPTCQFYMHRIEDSTPLKRWSSGRVVLVGDAAHVVTPNMGQGACMGIEDAFSLSTHLYRFWRHVDGHIEAFYTYESARKEYASAVRSEARKQLWLGQLTWWWAVRIREWLLRVIPAHVLEGKLKANCYDVTGGLEIFDQGKAEQKKIETGR